MVRLTAFYKILETGSFTRAAEAMGYTQAAISQMIRSLEKEYGIKLLVRTRTGVKLTSDGERLYPFIKKVVLSQRELDDMVDDINGLDTGVIRIGTFSSMSQQVVSRLMRHFSKLYPNAIFEIHTGDNYTLPNQLRDGNIDFAFLYPEVASGMVYEPLIRDAFVAVVPSDHPLAKREIIDLHEFDGQNLILLEEGCDSTVMNALNEMNIHPNVKFRIHDDYTIMSMVEQGLGISLLPAMITEKAMYSVARIPTDPPIKRSICIACNDEAIIPAATKKFISYIFEKIPAYINNNYTEIMFDSNKTKINRQ